jgi:hypothetical protein
MPLSHWTVYCAMVAEMSGHDAHFIMTEMPYALGLQFRTLWFQKKRIEFDSVIQSGIFNALEMIL